MKLILSILSLSLATFSFAAKKQEESSPIRFVPVHPTPEPDHVGVHITFPANNAMKSGSPVDIQLHIEGFPLRVMSDFPRRDELEPTAEGQSIRIVIDNDGYFQVNETLVNSIDDDEDFYDSVLDVKVPFDLESGMHVIRTFPVRSFGESLKGDGCFAAVQFYYDVRSNEMRYDLRKPYLTYNEPQGQFQYRENGPILLDFYISNCELSRDGYQVRVSIDGKAEKLISEWRPYYIYGLERGSHSVRLQLVDSESRPIPGPLNDVSQTIQVN